MLSHLEEWWKQFRLTYKSTSRVKKPLSSELEVGDVVRAVSSEVNRLLMVTLFNIPKRFSVYLRGN